RPERGVAARGEADGGEASLDRGARAAGHEDGEGGALKAREGVELVAHAHRRAAGDVPAAAREPVGLVEREPARTEEQREPDADDEPPPPRSGLREAREERSHAVSLVPRKPASARLGDCPPTLAP